MARFASRPPSLRFSIMPACFSTSISRPPSTRSAPPRSPKRPRCREVLKSGWHFLMPIVFLVYALMYPDVTMLTPEKAAIVSTAILMVLAMIFGYRGKRLGILGMLRAIMDTGRVSLDIILIGAAAGIMVGIMSISGLAFSMTIQLLALAGGNVFLLLAADRGARLRSRHRPADGERLHPHRDVACAGAGQARRHADGGAYVRDVQRHSFDDHAAGGVRGLCCRQYRAHRRLDHRLDRLRGRLEHIHPAVPVRADA